MGHFAGSSWTNVSARGITELENILFELDFLEASKGAAPWTLTHRQMQWLQLTETEFAVEEAETLWLLSELCELDQAHCCMDGPQTRSSQATGRWKRQRQAELVWRVAESHINACGIGLSCPQNILSTVGHNIWPPAVAPEEHRLPIISVLHLLVPCRCSR